MGRKEVNKAFKKKNRTICVSDFHWFKLEALAGAGSVGDLIVSKFKFPDPPKAKEEPDSNKGA